MSPEERAEDIATRLDLPTSYGVQLIAAALRSARDEALEEAARLASNWTWDDTAAGIADAIRDLKSSPEKQES